MNIDDPPAPINGYAKYNTPTSTIDKKIVSDTLHYPGDPSMMEA